MDHVKEGARFLAARGERAYTEFLAVLMEQGGLTEAEAKVAFFSLHKARALAYDSGLGRFSVKHGAYLDRAVLIRASKRAESL